MVGQQKVGSHDDGRQHIVEVVRDAAGKLADRLHLLALRHLAFQRLLLGRIDRIDDRRLLCALALATIGHRVDIEADVALFVVGQTVSIGSMSAWPARAFSSAAAKAGRSRSWMTVIEADMAVDRIAVDNRREQRKERRIGAQDAAALVDAGDRHRRGIEEAREAYSEALRSAEESSPCVRFSTTVRVGPLAAPPGWR